MTTIDTQTGRVLPPGSKIKSAISFDPNTERYDPATKQVVPRTPDPKHSLAYMVEQLAAKVAVLEQWKESQEARRT
ncbi:MAG: hypothetical protein H3C27_15490 [Opitutaceae bacterium]|nr:hypothetical protein [Opitutaceae bacterium]